MDGTTTENGAHDILTLIGSIGVYQIILFAAVSSMEFLNVDSIAMNFMGGFMDHWCRVEPLQNYSFAQQQYIAIPHDASTDTGFEECHRFQLDFNNFTDSQFYEWDRADMTSGLDPSGHVYCTNWVYDRSMYRSTIRNRWDLVCDKSWLVEMVSTIYMAGRLLGSLTSGLFSDWAGRKTGLIIFHLFHVFGNVMCLYAQSYGVYVTGRFIMAFGTTGQGLCAFVLFSEVIGSKYRAMLGTLNGCVFSLGYMAMPVFAYYVRDDVSLQAVLTWPLFIFFSYAITLQESPRWLLSENRIDEADDVIHFIGEVNHSDLPEKLHLDHPQQGGEKVKTPEKGTLLDLFLTPNLRKLTLIIFFNWFTNSLVYYGLSLNTGRLAGSVYVNTFLMGAIEIPANLLVIYLMNRIGRKWSVGGSCVFGGVCSLVNVLLILVDATPWLLTTFSVLGKAGITMAFSGIYVYSVESFPTSLRNSGLGVASMCARISGMAAPFVGGPLTDVWAPLPPLIFAVFAISSGSLMFLGPETLNKKLPETLAEAEEFGKRHSRKDDTNQNLTLVSEVRPEKENQNEIYHDQTEEMSRL